MNRAISCVAAVLIIIVASLTIVGWQTGSDFLKNPFHTNFMAPNSALCLLAGSVSLLFLLWRSRAGRVISGFFAVFVALFGSLTVLEYLVGADFGFDKLFMASRLGEWTYPNVLTGRIAPNTAIALAFLGTALLTREVTVVRFRLSELLVLPALLISFLSLVGYLYKTELLYGFGSFSSMALQTALCLSLLSIGILWEGADAGMMGLILSHDAGGITARRMLMVTLLTLPVLGWIQAKAQTQNGFKPQFGAALLVIVSVVIFAVMIVRTSLVLRELDTKRRDAEEQLLRSHSELEELVERRTIALRHLSARLMQSQDEERRRIARELHDGLGQYLTALSINLDRISRDPAASAGVLAECRDLIGRTSSEIRTLSHLLHPPLLDEVGFASAARWYVEGFANRSGVKINLDIPPTLSRMSQDTEIGLFRILQEGLTNIHRHSGSDKADIRIDVDGDLLRFSIRDYGKGMAPATLQRWQADGTAGVGLTGMRERVNELKGKLDISSTAAGTRITVTVPTEWKAGIENRATA